MLLHRLRTGIVGRIDMQDVVCGWWLDVVALATGRVGNIVPLTVFSEDATIETRRGDRPIRIRYPWLRTSPPQTADTRRLARGTDAAIRGSS